MKVCISSTVDSINGLTDGRFGRCPFYAIYDDETKEYEFVENEGAKAAQGAGIKAAQIVVDNGVDIVITGNLGPNAIRVLQAGNIKIFKMLGDNIKEQIEYYNEGKLISIDKPGASHMGMGR
ncbi:NifB/NifX family molybdenum-iron cluster-binding protein [Vallitalea sp.]|uniref:NifB/NifX family molybdenum-iron cluster-binding protein n=1 Tax=Vallitalea sp. TaxID=1882829 RepID=UPI0025ED7B60|nr:NifB/NifX family molybdenum-iron cluster-binding protein [Vallitalea sp.]MCT4686014.1 NifB/NifX family molybdenum-iron cluster-binding protein [Vallitalea sp.]